MSNARNLGELLAADGQVENAKIDGVAATKLTGTIPDARLSAGKQTAKLPLAGGAMTGAITTNSTFDGRDVSTDGTKLDGVAASANNYVHPNHSGDVVSTADGAMAIQVDAVDIPMLSATGSASSATFLRGDNAWAVVDTNLLADTSPQLGGNLDLNSNNITGTGGIPAANLTGTIAAARLSTAATQAESDDSTKIATTAYVVDKITTLIGGAPSTLNDLNELAAAINDDASYNSTLTTALATKMPKSGGAFTGAVTTNSTFDGVDIATRDGVLTSTTATATAALPKAGGAMTGAITTNSTFDGRDVAADGVLATNALPKAGGTLTGPLGITTASTADTVVLTRGTTGHNNMLKFKTGSADKWIVGQRNDSTDHFRFYSYGTSSDVLSILTDGKVGIGTTNPASLNNQADRLVVGDGSGDEGITIFSGSGSGDSGNIFFADAASDPHWVRGGISYQHGTDQMQFRVNDGNRMEITSAGKVGIGTSSPASGRGIQGAVLHISDTPDAALRITDTGGSDFEISAETNTTMGTIDNTALNIITNNTNRMTIGNDGRVNISQTGNATAFVVSTSVAAETTAIIQGGGTGNVDVLDIRDSGGNTKFKVRQNGKVGIGTTSPAATLEVVAGVNNAPGTRFTVRNSNSSQNATIHIGESDTTTYGQEIRWEGNLGNTFFDNRYNHSTRPHMYFRMRCAGTPITAMTIDPAGKVGIGTTSPGDYHSNADNLVVKASGHGGITIASGTNNEGVLAFADGTGDSEEAVGNITYQHNGDTMRFTVQNDYPLYLGPKKIVGRTIMNLTSGSNRWADSGVWANLGNSSASSLQNQPAGCMYLCEAAIQHLAGYTASMLVYKTGTTGGSYHVIKSTDTSGEMRMNGHYVQYRQQSGANQTGTSGAQRISSVMGTGTAS